MKPNLVLIPSSIFVDKEMQLELGQIPPVMIPINSKPLLELIIKSYTNLSNNFEFVVIVDKGKDQIQRYISSRETPETIKLLEVTEKGLGISIQRALEKLSLENYDKLFLNFGDTVIETEKITEKDAIYYQDLNESFRWTSFTEENGKILKITDKLISDSSETNHIIAGVFQLNKPENFLKALQEAPRIQEMDQFYSALLYYLNQQPYTLIHTKKWYDFGHIDNYYQVKKEFLNKRFFNDLTIDHHRATIEKRSKNIDKFHNEIKWYLKIPEQLQCYLPRVFETSLDIDDPFIKMEYYGYPNLGEMYVWNSYNLGVWSHIFNSIFLVIDDMKKHKLQDNITKLNKSMTEMYYLKTIDRLSQLKQQLVFNQFWTRPIIINNKEYKSLRYYIEQLEHSIHKLLIGTVDHFNIIHGDFCLANILYDPKNRIIKLVDPRGKFGDYLIYGDYRYDLAKLSHSFNGRYESIITDNFQLQMNNNQIHYKVHTSEYQNKITQMFNNKLKLKHPEQLEAIHLIESLLFLSMIPLHKDFPRRQIVMLATGIEKLDAILQQPVQSLS